MAILDYSGILNRGVQGGGQVALETAGQLQGLRANEQMMQRQTQQDQAAQQASQAEAASRQQGAELLKTGTPDEIASFGIQNPGVMKDFVSAANFKDQTAVGTRVKYAQDILGGNVAPRQALEARIAEVESSGGDATGLRQTLEGDDAGIKLAAEKDLAVIAPKIYESYKKASTSGQLTPMTAYQSAMIKGGNADREIRKLEAENKTAENKLKKETNQVKLDELKDKVALNKDKQLQIKKGRTEAAESVVDSGKSTLGLISEIESHPGLSSAVGAKGVSSLFGALDSPMSGSDAAGVNALIETLEAQNFLTAIGQFKSAGGAGALSDNEGKKLGAALSNLSTSQSEKDFKKSLNIIKNLVNKQISRANKQIDPEFKLDKPKETINTQVGGNVDFSKMSLEELKAMRGKM